MREKKQQQDLLPKYATPVLTSAEVGKKAQTLDGYLSNFLHLNVMYLVEQELSSVANYNVKLSSWILNDDYYYFFLEGIKSKLVMVVWCFLCLFPTHMLLLGSGCP